MSIQSPTSAFGESRFLDLRALASLHRMRFTTRHRIEGSYSGRHVSRQQGGAGEFVDYREYSGGEDLRRLDWKVLARTGKAFVRLHQDETNLACVLAVDASGSMNFGAAGPVSSIRQRNRLSKIEFVQYLTTALSHVITNGQDQVGFALLGGTLLEYIPAGGTQTHARQVRTSIEQFATVETLQMAPAMDRLFERVRGRGVLLLASDFLMDDLSDVFAKLRSFRHRGWEVVALHVVHPDEERLPDGLAYQFEGLENDGTVQCSPFDIRKEYEERFAAHLVAVRQLSLAAGCDYRLASTGIPYIQTLQSFLVERSG